MYLPYNWIQSETHIFYLLALCQHILSNRRKYSPIPGQYQTDNQSLKFKPLHSFSANCARGWNVLSLFVLSMWRLFCFFKKIQKILPQMLLPMLTHWEVIPTEHWKWLLCKITKFLIFEKICVLGLRKCRSRSLTSEGYFLSCAMTTEWPSESDTTLRWYEQGNVAVRFRSRNYFGWNGKTRMLRNIFM